MRWAERYAGRARAGDKQRYGQEGVAGEEELLLMMMMGIVSLSVPWVTKESCRLRILRGRVCRGE